MLFLNHHQSEFQILAYVAVAMLLGAIIGLELEFKDKPAGSRTHMLVAGAAALLVTIGDVVTASVSQGADGAESCVVLLIGTGSCCFAVC